MRAFVGILALFVATPAVAADQFDLVCKVTKKEGGAGKANSLRFSVDLARRTYCSQPCTSFQQLSLVSPTTIVFTDWHGEPMIWREAVDRQTGKYVFEAGGTAHARVEADCTAAAFTGLPKTKF